MIRGGRLPPSKMRAASLPGFTAHPAIRSPRNRCGRWRFWWKKDFVSDSSIYPIAHDRYGIPGSPRYPHVIETPAGPIREFPIATVKLSKDRVAPIGGGGYLRLLPYRYTSAGIRRLNREENQPACIYFHPWEIDPDQPRLASGLIARLRTYTGVKGMSR